MRRKVRLNESDLHRIIKESVKRVLNETDIDAFDGDFNAYSEQFKPHEDSIEGFIEGKITNIVNLIYQAREEFADLASKTENDYPHIHEAYDNLYDVFKSLMKKIKRIDPSQVIEPYN